MNDLISRQAAIDALWKALYEYEDKTEKQFQESEDLDVGDWIGHRIFVQNMSDIDRQTILNLPSARPEQRWIPCEEALPTETDHKDGVVLACNDNGQIRFNACMDGRWVLEEPIAWAPLPEPYEEEQDEQGAG